MRVTRIGGPTALVEWEGWRILTDPTFDPPGRTYSFAAGTSSRKTTDPAIALEEIGPVDVVLLSHFSQQEEAAAAVFDAAPGHVRERVRWAPLGVPIELG
jgi:L-ascorbate metabolism protein UlaG (beta-lactamase superfamily)